MGKRSHSSIAAEPSTNEKTIKPSLSGETFPNKFMTNMKSKKLKKFESTLEINEEQKAKEKKLHVQDTRDVELSSCNQKVKEGINSIDKVSSNVSLDSNLLAASPNKNVKTKRKNANDESRPNTKIKFTDGEPDEDSQNATNSTIDNLEFLNEEDVKDEDIDKFCDEITEEDNEQYESWVKLIEAKLSGNKKKPK